MDFSPSDFADHLPQGLTASVIVGQNGAGKSRFLVELAECYRQRNRSVVAISNTPYDRFVGIRWARRISASFGRELPRRLVKKAISTAVSKSPNSLDGIAETLRYCKYDPIFVLTLYGGDLFEHIQSLPFRSATMNYVDFVTEAKYYFDHLKIVLDIEAVLPPEDFEDVQLAIDLLLAEGGRARRVYELSKFGLETSRNRDFARLIRLENKLRRLHLLRRLTIEISREGRLLQLNDASSGELTLISTLVFLAISLPRDAVLLIDEPENSLHPQWQKEYLARLLGLLNYQQPTVVIATHAPLIVSGAQLERGLPVGIFEARDGRVSQISEHSADEERQSVEETLWETFRTITPKSHFVSESLANELERVFKRGDQLSRFWCAR